MRPSNGRRRDRSPAKARSRCVRSKPTRKTSDQDRLVPPVDHVALERIFREESGRVIARLIRLFGDIDVAEEAVQEAFVIASERWPADGLPPNPGGWITTTARNRA